MSESDVSVYTDNIYKAIQNIPQEYLELDEKELTDRVNPTFKMHEIRRKYWQEIVKAQDENRKMKPINIYKNTYSMSAFFKLLRKPLFVAWLTHPLTSYEDKTRTALDIASSRYEELVNMDITKTVFIKNPETGEVEQKQEIDPKKASVLLTVIKNIEDRVKGTAVQRQVSVTGNKPDKEDKPEWNMDAIDSKLKELENKLGMGDDNGRNEDNQEYGRSSATNNQEDRGTEDYIEVEVSRPSRESES